MFLLSMDTALHKDSFIEPDHRVVRQICAGGPSIPFSKSRYPIKHIRFITQLHERYTLQIIHDHGMWLPCNHVTAVAARRLGIPLVVSPRGMVEPWALSFKSWKKKIVWRLWGARDMANAMAFCATAQQEADNLRKLGFRQPIAIIPNGVDIVSRQIIGIDKAYPTRQALFLSRLHPIKGVCELIEAWSEIRPPGWNLVIAGPDENGYSAVVRRCITKHGLEEVVRMIGPVEGEAKWRLYQKSDLFILPTYSENFGIVVAEALSMGVPVITTKGAPWQVLIEEKCGWWIDIGVEPLTRSIKEATSLNRDLLREMGSRGRRLAERSFSWDLIAEKMELFYLWLIGKNDKPDWVDV